MPSPSRERESALWTAHSQGEGETHSIVCDSVSVDARMWGGGGLACLTRTDCPWSRVPVLKEQSGCRLSLFFQWNVEMLGNISTVLTDLHDSLPHFLLYSLPLCQEADHPHFISSPPRVIMRWLFVLILCRTVVYTEGALVK